MALVAVVVVGLVSYGIGVWVNHRPESEETRYQRVLREAKGEFDQAKFDASIAKFRAYLATPHPAKYNAEIDTWLGAAYENKQDYAEALKWYRAQERDGGQITLGIALNIARMAKAADDKPVAIEYYKKVIEYYKEAAQKPDSRDAYLQVQIMEGHIKALGGTP